jgi:tetratricopeptide (TPR) repeat protein
MEEARLALFRLDMNEAIRLSREAIALGGCSEAQRDKLYEVYTDALIAAGQLDEAEQETRRWFDDSPSPINQATATLKRANILHRKGEDALPTLDEAQRLARECGDKMVLGKVLRLRGDILWTQGSIEKALFLLQQSLAINEVLGDKDQQLGVHVSISIVYDLMARPWNAVQSSLRAATLCEEQGDTFSLMIICNNIAEQYQHLFALPQSLEYIRKARTLLSSGINGDLDRNEGVALLALGRRDEGLALLRRGVEHGDISDHDELLQAMYSLAEGLLTLGYVSEAAGVTGQLVDDARRLSATRHMARGALLMGQVAARRGDFNAAEGAFEDALINGQKAGDKWLIWQAHAAIASSFYEAQPPLAEFHRTAVIEMLNGIANSIPDAALREGFRNAPPIARWLRDGSIMI